MQLHDLYPILLALLALSDATQALGGRPSNSVLLTNIKTLTLRKDAKTTHRRVSAIPQLKCVGGNARGLYEVDVMRCKNAGSDYDDDNVQWTCTASLPDDFKLAATDVICEGYGSPNDPYVLKGSCGVEYRLMLTERGEEKYGSGGWGSLGKKSGFDWSGWLFMILFFAVAGYIVYAAWTAWQGAPRARRPPRIGRGGWGGWGDGGGGGGGNDPWDPPPPYTPRPKPSSSRAVPGQEGWRPGFWSGILGGAAAGYMAGNRGQRRQEVPAPRSGWFGGGNSDNSPWGAGPSQRPNTRSSSNSGSSSRYESTGFGSTSRR